jgi:hypothetical protein
VATTRRRRPWWADRSTGDVLILLIAATICFATLASGAWLAILAMTQPTRDVSQGFATIADVINTLIGLLAGFLAGRTDAHMNMTLNADGSRTWEARRTEVPPGTDDVTQRRDRGGPDE